MISIHKELASQARRHRQNFSEGCVCVSSCLVLFVSLYLFFGRVRLDEGEIIWVLLDYHFSSF